MPLLINFKRDKSECKCGCGQDVMDHELYLILENVREHFNAPVYIISGNRCIKYNEKIQKRNNINYVPFSSDSQHLYGKAADIRVQNISPFRIYCYLVAKYPGCYGIGKYKTFTHIDTRSLKARW